MVACGLLSGTQPLTLMGLLVVMAGQHGRRNAWWYVFGSFSVQALVVLASGFALSGTIDRDTRPGGSLIGLRIAVGIALVGWGLWLRRPAKNPPPEVPKALERLTNLRPGGAFLAGVAIADYTGALLAAAALTSATVSATGAVGYWLLYCSLATGLPAAATVAVTRSARAETELHRSLSWLMRNRRPLSSWICMVAGLALVADGLTSLLVTS